MIAFDGEKTAWGLCEGVPVCVATDKIRPCSAEETLAYLYLNKNKPSIDYSRAGAGEQENFIDARKVEETEKEQRRLDAEEARKREIEETAEVDPEDGAEEEEDAPTKRPKKRTRKRSKSRRKRKESDSEEDWPSDSEFDDVADSMVLKDLDGFDAKM